MKKIAVFSGAGIGDGLIMMVASHALQKAGYDVTTFNNHLGSIGPWMENHRFLKRPHPDDYEEAFAEYDTIIVHHENSHQAKGLAKLDPKKHRVILFYNNYRPGKHPPLEEDHFAFDEKRSMVENVQEAMQKLLPMETVTRDVGMTIPKTAVFQKNPNRIILHPTSSTPEKNWTPRKFISLARKLLAKGFQPAITTSPKERPGWLFATKYGIDVPLITTLSDLTKLLYESGYFIGNDSGPGHFANYLKIPTIVLAGKTNIDHWRPDFEPVNLVLPPPWAPNLKGPLRLRKNKWYIFITVSRVMKEFQKVSCKNPLSEIK